MFDHCQDGVRQCGKGGDAGNQFLVIVRASRTTYHPIRISRALHRPEKVLLAQVHPAHA